MNAMNKVRDLPDAIADFVHERRHHCDGRIYTLNSIRGGT